MEPLTERQQRELEYHRKRARSHEDALAAPFSWAVLQDPSRRWWNAYWRMYAYLLSQHLEGKSVLVVGCGFGDDALRISKLGAHVSAFDLSPETLEIAKRLAAREGLDIDFQEMPAEKMKYPDAAFDIIVARDILHHVDITKTMAEVVRVAKPGALFVVNEIYSHSWTDKVRHSTLVEGFAYPKMRKFIYGTETPYITIDERKLSEHDLRSIRDVLEKPEFIRFFNFIATRLVPDRIDSFAKLDQLLLRGLGPTGLLLAGRVLFGARVKKREHVK